MKSSEIKRRYPRLFNAWRGMRERCNNPNHVGAKYYFNKGIKVAKEWDDINVFLEWALNNGYRIDLTIDRIDGTKGYSPENCRWATTTTQARNLSKNRKLEFAGKSLCVSEWAEVTGIASHLIAARIDRLGWSVGEALTIPAGLIPTGPKPRNLST